LEFEISNISDEDLDIKLVDMPAGMFKLHLPKKIKAGKTETGKLEVLDEWIEKEFEKSITIEISDDAMSRFTIPVKRQVRILGTKSTIEQSDE